MIKKVYVNTLPKWDKGENKGKINWNNSVNHSVSFIYDDIEGEIKILENLEDKIKVEYDKFESIISKTALSNANIGKIVGKIIEDYRYQVGKILLTKSGEMKILDRFIVKKNKSKLKTYTCECLIDSHIWNTSEYNIKDGEGCPVCSGKVVIKGINDINTTDTNIVKYLKNKSDAYLYTRKSSSKIMLVCPHCNSEKRMLVYNLVESGFKCNECEDGISYGEKFVFSFLTQLNIEFHKEKVFNWSKNISHENINLCGFKKYDFYIPSFNTIIEVDGLQHHRDYVWNKSKLSHAEIVLNDEIKKDLALKNGIKKYMQLDAIITKETTMSNIIKNSELNILFDLKGIDWEKCDDFANNSLLRDVCVFWSNGVKETSKLSKMFGINKSTVIRYLKKGSLLGLCQYNSKESLKDSIVRSRTPIKCVEKNIEFVSIKNACETSLEKLGVQLKKTQLLNVCKNGNEYKGFHFKYI